MHIKHMGKIGGGVIVVTMALAVMLAAVQVNEIRFGGPIHQENQQISDLVADILPPPEYVIEPYVEASRLVNAPAELKERTARLAVLEKQFNDRLDYWRASNLSAKLKSALVDEAAVSARRFFDELNKQLLPALERGDSAAAAASYARLSAAYEAHRKDIDVLVAAAAEAQKALAASTTTILSATICVLLLLALLVMGMLLGGVYYLIRHALTPLADTAEAMRAMAGGDYDVAVAGAGRADEIGTMVAAIEVFRGASRAQAEAEAKQRLVVVELGNALGELSQGRLAHRITADFAPEYVTLRHSFNETVEGLAAIMARVAESAGGVHTGATEIRAASDDLASRTEQQAASLEETAAAMGQVTDAVKETARNASGVNASINEAHREATEGGHVVERAIAAMGTIEQSSQEISQIVNVIDGIAFQTNLLALNAGVEAARAGDTGKGFAVVASEVRALAQRSADAAKDIKALITASSKQVSDGVTLVGDTGAVLSRIVERVGDISERITGIAKSADIQAVNLVQVNSAVGEMDKMTQQNAAMVEQSTAAARSLAAEADQLAALVGRFDTGIGTKRARAFAPSPALAAARTDSPAARLPAPRFAAPRPAVGRAAPLPVRGNLAINPVDDGEDWTEF